MTFALFVLVDLVLIAFVDVTVVRPIICQLRRRIGSKRLGLLFASGTPTAEAQREARLRELGEAGTYVVHNCGKILHVDYERGELICEKELDSGLRKVPRSES